jgi:hypothetical protein
MTARRAATVVADACGQPPNDDQPLPSAKPALRARRKCGSRYKLDARRIVARPVEREVVLLSISPVSPAAAPHAG